MTGHDLTDADWVRKGREHAAAGRFLQARECYQRALGLNPKNGVARKRLAELERERKLSTAYRSGCLVCGLSVTSLVDRRCTTCRYYRCPQGHCACTARELREAGLPPQQPARGYDGWEPNEISGRYG